jgi:MFS family permease
VNRRASFAAVAAAFAVTMFGTTVPTPLYGLYAATLGLSELTITTIYATYAAGVIAGLLLFGSFSDVLGRRRMLLPGLALSGLSAVVFLFAHGLPLLFLGRVLSGLSAGIFTGTATATLVDLADAERRSRATLIATVVNMGGLGLGPLLAGVVSEAFGAPLRVIFAVDLALVLIAAAFVWRMHEPVSPSPGRRLRPQGLSVPPEVRATFIRSAIAAFAGFAVLGSFTAVAPAFLGELGYHNRIVIGVVVFATFAASTLGQLALERLPEHRALPVGCVALVLGMAVLALGLAASTLAALVAGGVLAGFGQGLSFRAGLAAVNAQAPGEQRARVASSFFVVAYVAISLPVIGVGALAQATSLTTAGLLFAGLVAALAVVVLVLLLRPAAAPAPEKASGKAGS